MGFPGDYALISLVWVKPYTIMGILHNVSQIQHSLILNSELLLTLSVLKSCDWHPLSFTFQGDVALFVAGLILITDSNREPERAVRYCNHKLIHQLSMYRYIR